MCWILLPALNVMCILDYHSIFQIQNGNVNWEFRTYSIFAKYNPTQKEYYKLTSRKLNAYNASLTWRTWFFRSECDGANNYTKAKRGSAFAELVESTEKVRAIERWYFKLDVHCFGIKDWVASLNRGYCTNSNGRGEVWTLLFSGITDPGNGWLHKEKSLSDRTKGASKINSLSEARSCERIDIRTRFWLRISVPCLWSHWK